MERLTAVLARLAGAFRTFARAVCRAVRRAIRPWRRWLRRHVVRDLPSHSPQWRRAARGIDCRMLSWRRRLVSPKG